ncbi:MAG: glycosyltransferase family 4 protein [Acidobacteriales bacterium]|nr:glycosyltransferase family 4 protein [Terriglobales bacterium]
MNARPDSSLALAVNARYRAHAITGQQRYAHEIVSRLQPYLCPIEPEQPLAGLRGHAWEQLVLPRKLHGRLLWSPCQSGPMFLRNHVVTFHDLFPVDNPEWFSRKMALWYSALLPRLAKNSRILIAVSEFTKQRIVERFRIPPEKIAVIYNGVGHEFQPQPPTALDRLRQAVSLPTNKYLLTVGSLEPRKNLARLLTAWNDIQGDLPPDYWLVVAGMKGKASVFARDGGRLTGHRVCFAGYVEQDLLPALYAGARALLHPAIAEGFGLPLLEAMACGTPSLAAKTSSMPEVTGGIALFVDPLNTQEMARGIRDLVSSDALRDDLSRRGLQWAPRFNWETAAAQTLDLLQNVALSRSSRQR